MQTLLSQPALRCARLACADAQVTLMDQEESEVAQSCPTLCDPTDYSLPGSSRVLLLPGFRPWNPPGESTGVGSRFLLQGIFLTRGSNPDLLQCMQILYRLSHQGSPRNKYYYYSSVFKAGS